MGNPIDIIEDAVEDAGDWVGDQIEDAVDFVVEDVPDAVSDAFSSFEDGVRNAIEGVDDLVQNPYVRMAVRFIPGYGQIAGTILDTYAKLDSGEELSAGDIASLAATFGSNNPTDWKLTDNQVKAVKTAGSLADGDDPINVLVSAYGEDVIDQMGLKDTAISTLQNSIGEDAYNIVSDNLDLARTGYDIVVDGKDPLEAISNRYGEEIVGYLGADTPNERALGLAGLTTAVGLDKGLDAEDALLRGAQRYADEGGTVDLNQLAGLTGVDVDFGSGNFFNKYATTFGNFEGLPDLSFIEDYVRQYGSGIEDGVRFVADNLPNLNLEGVDYDYLRNQYNMNIRDLKAQGIDVGQLAFNTDIDLGIPSIEVPDADLPNVEVSGIDLPDVNIPDIPLPGLRPVNDGAPIEVAGLDIADREALEQQAKDEEIPISELLLQDFQLKNPLLKT